MIDEEYAPVIIIRSLLNVDYKRCRPVDLSSEYAAEIWSRKVCAEVMVRDVMRIRPVVVWSVMRIVMRPVVWSVVWTVGSSALADKLCAGVSLALRSAIGFCLRPGLYGVASLHCVAPLGSIAPLDRCASLHCASLHIAAVLDTAGARSAGRTAVRCTAL